MRQREVSEHMLRRMLNQKLHAMFNNWRHNIITIKCQCIACEHVAARIKLHSETKCFHQWLNMIHIRQRVTRKWINQNLTVGWHAWIQYLHNSRAAEVKQMQLSVDILFI